MFHRYKHLFSICFLVLWSLVLFLLGGIFQTPTVISTQQTNVTLNESGKRVNEKMRVVSKSDGEIEYRIRQLSYTTNKQILFHLRVETLKSAAFIVRVVDSQNQDIHYRQIDHKVEDDELVYQVEPETSQLNGDIFILVYPASKEMFDTQKTVEKAYGKTKVNIPEVKAQTIEKLQ